IFQPFGGETQVRIHLENAGAGGASNVIITSMTLDGVSPDTANMFDPVPRYLGNVGAGGTSIGEIVNYMRPNKPSGTTVLLKVKGTFDWYGTFNATLRVQLP